MSQGAETPQPPEHLEESQNNDLKVYQTPEKDAQLHNKTNTATNTNFAKTGLWGGPRKNVGIKIDMNLYKAFKPIAQARYGSVCACMEGLMAGIVGAVHNSKVSMGNSIRIDGGMHVHRLGLKERRRIDPTLFEESKLRDRIRDKMLADNLDFDRVSWGGWRKDNLELCEGDYLLVEEVFNLLKQAQYKERRRIEDAEKTERLREEMRLTVERLKREGKWNPGSRRRGDD